MVARKMQLPGNGVISADLQENLERLQEVFTNTSDLNIRHLQLQDGTKVGLVYFEGLIDKVAVNEQILTTLMYRVESATDLFQEQVPVPVDNVKVENRWKKIEYALFQGDSILFVHAFHRAIIFPTQGWPQRSIKEPQSETSLYGSHEGFVETASMNLALIRRYIPNNELKIRKYQVGKRAPTNVYMVYLEDIINPQIVNELDKRIKQIDVDTVNNTGDLEELIESYPISFLPQAILTERPDTTASHILHGRLALVVDHSPNALIKPITFMTFFQSIDDYSFRWITGSFLRLLRLLALFIAVGLPSLYIAIISFHFEILPLDLMMSIGMSRERIPFPPIVEAFIMEVSIEMIREAGVKLPSPIGQTVGVVGGIVIGEAAVQAGIVSNIMVIVVAITAISSYIIPNYALANAIRIVRFPLMFLASMFGLVGIAIGALIIIIHLISMDNVGVVPYGSPIVPIRFSDWKDALIRAPLRMLKFRPSYNQPQQPKKQGLSRKKRDGQ